jgi:hypothetical protein
MERKWIWRYNFEDMNSRLVIKPFIAACSEAVARRIGVGKCPLVRNPHKVSIAKQFSFPALAGLGLPWLIVNRLSAKRISFLSTHGIDSSRLRKLPLRAKAGLLSFASPRRSDPMLHTKPTNRTQMIGLSLVALMACSLATASAAEWGSIKGRLIVKGTVPAPAKITPTKDVAVCGKHPLVDESVVVGKGGELANVFVYSREKKLAVHPDYAKLADEKVEMDNKFCRYSPHCAVVTTSQKLVLKNTDTVAHNVKGDPFKNGSFNILIPPNGDVEKEFTLGETLPATVGCNIHPWMSGYLLIRTDPYMAVTAADGTFEIKNLPVGEVEFQLWQEKAGYLDGAQVQGKSVKKGRFKVKVKPGVIDLGDIVVDAKLLKGK